jgi:acid stress-induced BolA-like protein IbaG/YrbA
MTVPWHNLIGKRFKPKIRIMQHQLITPALSGQIVDALGDNFEFSASVVLAIRV